MKLATDRRRLRSVDAGRYVPALILVLALGASGCSNSANSTSSTRASQSRSLPQNESLARSEATRLMSLVSVQTDWQPLAGPPGGRLTSIVGPSPKASPTLVTRTRYWGVRGNEPDVLTQLTAHPPRGLVCCATSKTSGGSNPTIDQIWLSPKAAPLGDPHRRRLASEVLSETLTSDPAGGTDLRVDAQVIWLPNRTAAQTISSTVTRVDIAVTSLATGRRRLAANTITDPHVIAKLRADVNKMIPVIPGTDEGICISPADPIWHATFLGPGGRSWIVTASRTARGEQAVISNQSKPLGPTLDAGSDLTDLLILLTRLPPTNC